MSADGRRCGGGIVAALSLLASATLSAHDLERTQVVLSCAPDGAFTLDVSNDPNWLLLRLESFAGGQVPAGMTADARDARLAALSSVFVDRVVLFVDGHEIRPEAAEYLAPRAATGLATFRLRGRMPSRVRALRWLYGLVIDPYPFTLRRADGRSVTEWIEGSNWSGTLDLSGQFPETRPIAILVTLFVIAFVWRWKTI